MAKISAGDRRRAKEIIGYVRVSTDRQGRDGGSLQNQESAIRSLAAQLQLPVAHIFRDIGSAAGKRSVDDRKGLQEALKAVRDHDGLLVVWDWSRLSRHAKPRTFVALSLLYHDVDWSGSTWHLDHIIPQSDAQKGVLRSRNIPDYRVEEILNSVNRLGNLQLLRSDENIEKSDLPFRSWITGRRVDFHEQHMIPERLDLCDAMALPEFVREREKLIRKRLAQVLGHRGSV